MGGCCCKERTETKITIETENHIDKIKTKSLLNSDYLDACEEVLDTINNKYKEHDINNDFITNKKSSKNTELNLPIGVMIDYNSDEDSIYETPRSYASI